MKEWKEYIVNYDAQPGKNSTFYKNHKPETLVISLTIGRNTATENWSRFLESICTPLTSNLSDISKDISHLVDLIDDINKSSLPDKLILVSLDIVNMFANMDWKRNGSGTFIINSRSSNNPSNECVMEGLEICLLNNNSHFANIHLQQTNDTATGALFLFRYSN